MDTPALSVLPRVRGFLFASSSAARYTLNLPLNAARVKNQRFSNNRARLPSPEDDVSNAEDSDVANCQSQSSFVVLQQTDDLHCFALGSALDSYLVLQHDPTDESTDSYYINLVHCRLYPDPDSPDLWLKNCSTSTQTIKGKSPGMQTTILDQDECVALQAGSWDIDIGGRLRFLCEIISSESFAASITTSLSHKEDSPKFRDKKEEPQGLRNRKQSSVKSNHLPKQIVQQPAQNPSKSQEVKKYRASLSSKDKSNSGSFNDTRVTLELNTKGGFEGLEVTESTPDVLGITQHSRVVRRVENGICIAVKVCRRPNIPAAADMWRQEENIVQLLGSDAIRCEIKLRYIPGKSVDKFVDDLNFCTLNESQCFQVWQGAAAGLAWIHDKNILYNDLKPGNTMFVPEEEHTILVDFGIASERIEGHFIGGGTPWYVAPEFRKKERPLVGDVWSLAILMMFCFKYLPLPEKTEEPWSLSDMFGPNNSLKMTKWLTKIKRLQRKIAPQHKLLHCMLEFEPTKRITSDALLNELSKMGTSRKLGTKQLLLH